MKHIFHVVSILGIMGALYSQSLADVPGAQKRLSTVSHQPITYLQVLPSAVTKRIPRGAKSRFFGSCRLSAKGNPVLIHLFDPNPNQKQSDNSNSYRLMLHVLTPQGQLLNTVPVGYYSTGTVNNGRYPWFGAQLLWLDPQKRRLPILKFDTFGKGGKDQFGSHILVTFAQGLNSTACAQSIRFGQYDGNLILGEYATFDRVDDKGLLEIHFVANLSYEALPNYENIPNGESQAKWVLRWDGHKFSAANDPFSGVDDVLVKPHLRPIW
jgi:hypothetical protein